MVCVPCAMRRRRLKIAGVWRLCGVGGKDYGKSKNFLRGARVYEMLRGITLVRVVKCFIVFETRDNSMITVRSVWKPVRPIIPIISIN